ncbi:hypothetical protein EBB07_10790 [Paenibacillaceae bacterium]|nr:hypothetical protein EBB07_10790 [Paenibacillaceae bacterium]
MKEPPIQSIIEDLLPLHEEGLLREETAAWLEEQLASSAQFKQLAERSLTPLPKPEIPSALDYDPMVKKIKRTLSLYQIIFIAISFFLALQTSLLNSSFEFVLWYAVLGALIYLFYQDMKMVFLIAFIPILFWSIGGGMSDYFSGSIEAKLAPYALQTVFGGILVAGIHYAVALMGSLVGLCIVKLKGRG